MLKNDGYALLIGVEDYSAFDGSRRQGIGTSDLPGSRNDVRAYWTLCRKLGYAPENIRVLTSPPLDAAELEGAGPDTIAPATREEILAKVAWLADKLGQRGRPSGLLTFSGHGDVTAQGLAICPSDATLGEGALDHAVTFAEVDALLCERDAGENLTVLLDTCHSGAAGGAARGRELTLRKRPLAEEAPRDVLGARVLAAAGRDQVACQAVLGGEWRGVFSWAITTAMEQWKISQEGTGTRLDVTHAKLMETAERLTAALWFDQKPELRGPRGLAELPVFHRGLEAHPGETAELPNADRRTQQIDPGVKNYVVYVLTQAGVQIGKVLVTGPTAGDGYEANREYWYLTANVSMASSLTFTGGASEYWSTPPSGLGTLSFVTNRTPTWTSGTPRGTFLLETNALTGEKIGINWQMTESAGVWSGSIYWWHSTTNNIFGPSTTNTLTSGTPASGTWYYYQTSPL